MLWQPNLIGVYQGQILTWLNIRNLSLSKTADPEYAIKLCGVKYGEMCNNKAKYEAKDRVVKDQNTSDYRSEEL